MLWTCDLSYRWYLFYLTQMASVASGDNKKDIEKPQPGHSKSLKQLSSTCSSRSCSTTKTVTSSNNSSTTCSSNSTALPAHSVIVTADSNPSRVLGWKSSKTFSKTMSSIEVAPPNKSTSSSSSFIQPPCIRNSSGLATTQPRAAAIRIQMAEPVGPSAYSLSLQQRNASEQWKLLKNRLLRKKSTEEPSSPVTFSEVVMDRMRQMRRLSPHMQESENGIVCKTNELKKLLKSESGDNSGRNSNRNSFDAATAASAAGGAAAATGTENQSSSTSSSSPATVVVRNSESPSSSNSSPKTVTITCSTTRESSDTATSPSSSSSTVKSTVKWDEVSVFLSSSQKVSIGLYQNGFIDFFNFFLPLYFASLFHSFVLPPVWSIVTTDKHP